MFQIIKSKIINMSSDKRSMIIAIVINVTILIFTVFCMNLVFETNDDREFSNILSGAFGESNSSYIVFINIIFSSVVKFFYLFSNQINWYVLLCLGFSCIGFTIISYYLIGKYGLKKGVFLCFIFILFCYKDQYIVFQFTKNAAFFATTGMFGLLMELNKENRCNKFVLWLSGILIIVATLIRFKATLPIFLFYFTICVYELFFSNKTKFSKVIIKEKKKYIVVFVSLFMVMFSFKIFNDYIYSTNFSWNSYLEINKANFNLLGYGEMPNYKINKEKFKELNISENDYNLYCDWSIGDLKKFSLQTVKEISTMRDNVSINDNKQSLGSKVMNIYTESNTKSLIFVCFIVGLYSLIHFNSRNRVLILIIFIELIAMILYLCYSGRVPHRVSYGLFIGFIISLLYIYENLNITRNILNVRKMNNTISLGFIIFLLFAHNCYVIGHINFKYKIDGTYTELIEEAKQHKDLTYFFDRPTLTYLAMNGCNPLKVFGKESHSNIAYLGGWIALTPVNQYALEESKTDNLFEVLAKNENSRLVDNRHSELIYEYLLENYNSDLEMVLEKEVGTVKIYKFIERDRG